MKPTTTLLDIAIPIEVILEALGLEGIAAGVYHSQKTNTLFIRMNQEELPEDCLTAVVKDKGDTIDVDIRSARVKKPGPYKRYLTSDFRLSNYEPEKIRSYTVEKVYPSKNLEEAPRD